MANIDLNKNLERMQFTNDAGTITDRIFTVKKDDDIIWTTDKLLTFNTSSNTPSGARAEALSRAAATLKLSSWEHGSWSYVNDLSNGIVVRHGDRVEVQEYRSHNGSWYISPFTYSCNALTLTESVSTTLKKDFGPYKTACCWRQKNTTENGVLCNAFTVGTDIRFLRENYDNIDGWQVLHKWECEFWYQEELKPPQSPAEVGFKYSWTANKYYDIPVKDVFNFNRTDLGYPSFERIGDAAGPFVITNTMPNQKLSVKIAVPNGWKFKSAHYKVTNYYKHKDANSLWNNTDKIIRSSPKIEWDVHEDDLDFSDTGLYEDADPQFITVTVK